MKTNFTLDYTMLMDGATVNKTATICIDATGWNCQAASQAVIDDIKQAAAALSNNDRLKLLGDLYKRQGDPNAPALAPLMFLESAAFIAGVNALRRKGGNETGGSNVVLHLISDKESSQATAEDDKESPYHNLTGWVANRELWLHPKALKDEQLAKINAGGVIHTALVRRDDGLYAVIAWAGACVPTMADLLTLADHTIIDPETLHNPVGISATYTPHGDTWRTEID